MKELIVSVRYLIMALTNDYVKEDRRYLPAGVGLLEGNDALQWWTAGAEETT